MGRRLLIVAVFLLAGAVVNVTVAWVITAGTNWPGWGLSATSWRDVDWPYPVPSHWPERAAITIQGGGFGWRCERYQGSAEEERDGELWRTEEFVINITRVGWPCRALQSEKWIDWVLSWEPGVLGHHRNDGQTRWTWWRWGIAVPFDRFGFGSQSLKTLPLSPLLLGFAVNTFFYAGLIWLIIPGPFALLRLIRQRRGLCPACGYDLRYVEDEACPECGASAAVDGP